MIAQHFYSFSLSAILLFCMAVPVTVADMEPVESQAPLGHSMLGALPQRTIDHGVIPNADLQLFGTPPMVFKRAGDTVAPLNEGTVDRPVSGDISEMSIQDNQPKALRRRWYPYSGYGGYGNYPYYPYYPYGGGLNLELGLGLGLHL